jgi:hypothetical protein
LNFHIRGGAQFDPHLETLEYINCEPRVRRSIANRLNQYDDIRILFRTRFLKLDGKSNYIVTGCYVVGGISSDECRDAPVIKASRAKFLSIVDCVNITRLLQNKKAYRSCFSTENRHWEPHLRRWTAHVDGQRDMMSDYVRQIKRLKKIYGENEFQNSCALYDNCRNCRASGDICRLIKRRMRYGSLPRLHSHFV